MGLAVGKLLRRGGSVAAVLLCCCGSRTGLFAEKDTATHVVVQPPIDAGVDAPPREGKPCVPGTFTLTRVRPEVMLVLDRSESMRDAMGTTSRWTALRQAVTSAILPLADELPLGARFFPDPNVVGEKVECSTDPGTAVLPALGTAPAILELFESPPEGATPTAAALRRASEEVTTNRSVARAIVLATDGAPNCNGSLNGKTCVCTADDWLACARAGGATSCLDDVQTVQVITTIFATRRIPVYVVGVGPTAAFEATLDAMAEAGGRPRVGTPRYYDAADGAGLTAALASIHDGVARCTYEISSSPDSDDAIEVELDGRPVPRDPTHVEGWDWVDDGYGRLELFGSACALARDKAATARVRCGT